MASPNRAQTATSRPVIPPSSRPEGRDAEPCQRLRSCHAAAGHRPVPREWPSTGRSAESARCCAALWCTPTAIGSCRLAATRTIPSPTATPVRRAAPSRRSTIIVTASTIPSYAAARSAGTSSSTTWRPARRHRGPVGSRRRRRVLRHVVLDGLPRPRPHRAAPPPARLRQPVLRHHRGRHRPPEGGRADGRHGQPASVDRHRPARPDRAGRHQPGGLPWACRSAGRPRHRPPPHRP
jgi:hypothetical protein